MKKRVIAIILTLCMTLSLSPATASAGELDGWPEETLDENVTETSQETLVVTSDGDTLSIPSGGVDIPDSSYDEDGQDSAYPYLYDTLDAGSVTKGAWLAELVNLFQMTLTQDEYPDVYFPDIEGTAYYDAIMIATKYGLVDVEAGESFDPDGPLTREYAAYTLNFCLGLQSSGAYTYSDQNDVTYQNDAQVALDNGWLAPIDGAFCPQMAVTAVECAAMTQNAQSILQSRDVSTRVSNYQFADYVKVIPSSAEIITEFDPDTGARTLTIYGYDGTLSAGDTFAYYYEDFAFVFSAQDVDNAGGFLVVETAEPPADAILQYEYSGSLTPEITDFVPDSEPVTLMEADGTAVTFGAVRAVDLKNKEITFTRDIFKSDGIRGTLNGKITVDRLDVKINGSNKYAKLIGRIEITSTVEFDALNDPAARGLTLGGLQLGSFGFVGLELSLKMEAKISYTYNADYEFGFQYAYSHGSIIMDFHTSGSGNCFSADGTVSAQMSLAAYIDLGAAGCASGKIGAGPVIKAGYKKYGSGTPSQCFSLSGYLYAGITWKVKITDPLSRREIYADEGKYDFYNETNSPIRVHVHAEDGIEVAACTRGSDSGTTSGSYAHSKYYTPSDSRYYASGSSNVNTGASAVVTWLTSDNGDGTVTVTGYKGSASILNIPETVNGKTVTAIGGKAFQNNISIRIVNMPNTVTSIGSYSFENCTGLRTLTFSENLTKIGFNAFSHCTSLTRADLPEGLNTLEGAVFSGCTALAYAYIPSTLEKCYNSSTSANGAFYQCSSLNDIEFGPDITTIPAYLFSDCTGLTHIEIPDTVTSIGSCSFQDCINLVRIEIPEYVTSIGSHSFENCTNLQAVRFNENLTEIGYYAFGKCTSLTRAELPEGLTTLNGATFAGCTALTYAYIPSTLEKCFYHSSYANGAFYQCSSLNDIEFGPDVTAIPAYLFGFCTGLTHIEIPDTVTSIGNYSFQDCTNLTQIELPEYATSIGSYSFENCTSLIQVEIPDSVTSIGSYSFQNCNKLESVTFSKNLTKISYGAFYDCTSLTRADLPEGLITIEGTAFYRCTALTYAYIPSTLEKCYYNSTYVNAAFYQCSSLDTIEFGPGITAIPAYLFGYCTGLTHIEIPDTVTSIGNYSFQNCTKLTTIQLPDGITQINPYTFQNCTALENLDFLPASLTSIASSAFQGCTGLISADLPDLVSSLDINVFKGCTALTSFKAGNDLQSIGSYCFQDCTKLTDVDLNDGLTTIGIYAFQNCIALPKIVLPDSVTSIGTYTFQKDAKLADITLSAGLTEIPSYALANCTALTELVIPKGVKTIKDHAFDGDTKLKNFTVPASVTSIGTSAFSYAATTDVSGVAGSYVQTYAKWKTFTDITKAASGLTLSNGTNAMTIGCYLTVTPRFTFVPADSTDVVVSLASDNTSVVSVRNNTQLHGSRTGSANITATTFGGRTYTFSVTVDTLSGIEITHLPDTTDFGLKDDKDVTGLVVSAVFSNGSREEVYGYTVKGFSTDSEGVKPITVTYEKKTAAFDITVAKVETGVMRNPSTGETVNWSYNNAAQTVTISSAIPDGEQVCVARYGEGGRFLGLEIVRQRGSADVSQSEEIRLIWTTVDTYIPICESETIQRNHYGY